MPDEMILPDDFVEEPATPQAEEPPKVAEEGTPTEQQQPAEVQPKIKIKFNHEEKELGVDEAVPLIQKGMNYDKLQEKLKGYENSPELSFLSKLAEENNMTVQEYMDAVEESREQQKINELVQKNIPEDIAKEILESRKLRQEFKDMQKRQADDEKLANEYNELIEAFPDAKIENLDKRVWELNAKGAPLKYAYMEGVLEKYKTENQILRKNEENTKKTPVSGVTTHGSQEVAEEDAFLQGFNSI